MLWQCGQQRLGSRIVAKGLAHVREPIYIAWTEDEAATKLKRIPA
jgi:hypothetical protein